MSVQILKQRIANEKFNKKIERTRKYGKKKISKNDQRDKLSISKYWLISFTFLLVGGGILELISLTL